MHFLKNHRFVQLRKGEFYSELYFSNLHFQKEFIGCRRKGMKEENVMFAQFYFLRKQAVALTESYNT